MVCTTSGLTGIPAILIGRIDEILSLPTQQGGMVQILQLAIATVVEEVLGVYNCQIIQMEPLKLKVRLAVKEPAEEQLVWEALQTRLVGYLAAQGITDVTIEKAPEPPQLHPKSGKFRCIERLMCSASSPCAHDKKRRFPMELSPIRGQAPAPSNHLVQSMRQHPLLFYFVIAFGLSWAYEVLVFGVLHIPFSLLLNLPLTLGPMLAAFLMTAVTQGRAGILQLLRRFVRWRAGLSWYLLVLLGVPALLLLPYLTQPGAFSAFRLPDLSFWPTYLIVYLSTLVFGGPLGEEPGWRGFALPRLEQRSGPLVGTLLLGVLWGLWHLPLFLFVPGYNGAGTGFAGILIPFVAFVIPVIAFTITFTWVFNNTRGSILLAILLHTSINTAPTMLTLLFPSLSLNTLFGLSRILMWVVAAVLIIVATRGRLSYQRYLRETALPAPLSDREKEKDEVRLSA